MHSRPDAPTSRSLLCVLLTLFSLGLACASAPADGAERALVRLRFYNSDQRFELASESHTNAIAYYSKVRTEASRKVIPDDVLSALIGELEKLGFDHHAQAGRAPRGGSGIIQRSFEIQSGDNIRHWPIGSPSNPEEQSAFQEMMGVFLEAYNLTQSYQAVQNEQGQFIFDKRRARTP